MDEQYRRAHKLGIDARKLDQFEQEDEAKAYVDGYEHALSHALKQLILIVDYLQARL